MRGLGISIVALVVMAGAGLAVAEDDRPQGANCGGGTLVETIEGTFTTRQEGAYVMVPFNVPAGTTRVRARLSHDGIALPNPVTRHTLDLGLYEATDDAFWDEDEFRGWGGSSRLDACVSAAEATLGFKPGPVPAGEWAAEIGVAAVADPGEGDPDGAVSWKLEIFLSDDDQGAPWSPAIYDDTPVSTKPDWYAGDFHVHAEHSNPNDAPMRAVFDYAFDDPSGPQLDFITLSDYVTNRHWDEIGRFQEHYPDNLILRSAEVITYRGHVNNHASVDWVDYRTGPIYERLPSGSLEQLRGPLAPGADGGIFDQIHANGKGWSQVNHPTTFPASVPAFGNLCRGCSWEYSDGETDWSKVDAMEVATGPGGTPDQLHPQQPVGTDGTLGPNPFTPLAIEWFDRLQREGYDITAVGSSDSHKAGHQELTQSPIGEATTVVFAPELSEAGIREGVIAGHAYVKLFGNDGPDLRLTARPLLGGDEAMMGDELDAAAALFSARVFDVDLPDERVGPLTVLVLRDGLPYLTAPVVGDDFSFDFVGVGPGDYRLQVMRGPAIEALTNPINLEPAVPGLGSVNQVHSINGWRGKLHGTP